MMQNSTDSEVRPFTAAALARGLWPSKRRKSVQTRCQSPTTGVSSGLHRKRKTTDSFVGRETTLSGFLVLWLAFSAHLATTASLAEALPDIIKIGKRKKVSSRERKKAFLFLSQFLVFGIA